MPESATHADLVTEIINYAVRELGDLNGIAVRSDAVRPVRGERPPRVGGYTPDVYATDVPTTRTLIGEAKTRADLENDHTFRQLRAFLQHLALTPDGVLVLAVPLAARATARRLVAKLCQELGTPPRVVVLDDAASDAA